MTPEAAFRAAIHSIFGPDLPARLGLAVSGGGDSMALLHLAAAVLGPTTALHVVTVDHRLRPEAADEARAVAAAAGRLGLPHDTLVWSGWDGQGNLSDAARQARRSLIEGWAATHALDAIATGHTADDQAETVLMRLARGSGVDGLAGIAAQSLTPARWVRPLLGLTRADLRRWLTDRGIDWAEDPTNDDPAYDRVLVRHLIAGLAPLGLSVARLTRTADHMARAQDVLRAAADALAARAVTTDLGDLVIDAAAFDAAAAETRTRLMARALQWVGSKPYRPRYEALVRIVDAGSGVLHGCQVIKAHDRIVVTRELAAVADTRCATTGLWDHRWLIDGPHRAGLCIGPLTVAGLSEVPDWRACGRSRVSLIASPAIWDQDRLIAAPVAGYGTDWSARIVADFLSVVDTH